MRLLVPPLVLAIYLLSSMTALSTISVVDQQNLNNEGTLTDVITPTGAGYGQSFTPSLASLNEADFIIFVPAGGSATLQLELFAGSGLATPIALSTPITIAPTASAELVEFTFAQPVVVIPGQVYTFTILRPSGNGYAVQYGSNTYPGGNMFTPQLILPNSDLYFIEGVAVPEPSSVVLLKIGAAIGLASICGRNRATIRR